MTTEIRMATCVFIVLLDGELIKAPEHLGVSYLISILRQEGHKCLLVDVLPDEEQQAVDYIAEQQPDFVGISLTSVNIPRTIALGQLLRRSLGPSVHICGGGSIATFMGDRLLRLPEWSFFNSIVRGEGESVIVPLINAVLSNQPVTAINGVVAPGSLAIFSPLASPVSDLDTIPWAARDQIDDAIKHKRRFEYIRISTSRGCTSRCTFCNAPHAGNNIGRNKVWRGRSPEDVVDEIEHLVKTYGVDTYNIVDSTYEDPSGQIGKERIRKIANLILERGLRIYYQICSQAKNWTEEDVDLIHLLYKSGLERVLIGIESGSPRELELWKKRSTVEDNARAIGLFRQNHIYVSFGFIMFQPYADWEDIENNAEFLLKQNGHILHRMTTRLQLYPGSEIVHKLESDNLLNPDYWQTLDIYGYKYLNPQIAHTAQIASASVSENYLKYGMSNAKRTEKVPSELEFLNFDIRLHTYMTRIFRSIENDSSARDVYREHENLINVEKLALAEFNRDVFYKFLELGKNERELQPEIMHEVEDFYSRSIRRLQSIQTRLGIRLSRHGKFRALVP